MGDRAVLGKPQRIYITPTTGKRNADSKETFRVVIPHATDGRGNVVTMIVGYQSIFRGNVIKKVVDAFVADGHTAPEITNTLKGLFDGPDD